MIDLFAIVLTHGLLALAAWRLLSRGDLDGDPEPGPPADEDAPPPRVKRGLR
jgi:hypothetical protein